MTVAREHVTHGRITDEDVAKMRMRIGYAIPYVFLFNTTATPDSIVHFAHGYGDDNPLYADFDYGRGTRWKSQIAPPMFYQTMGYDQSPPMPEEVRRGSKGALRGVHQFFSGAEWEFFAPIYPGDVLDYRGIATDVEMKDSTLLRER